MRRYFTISKVAKFVASWMWMTLGIMAITRYEYKTLLEMAQLLSGSWLIVYALKG